MIEPTRIALIIVSYNTAELLRNALASIARAQEASADLVIDAIVVDNASSDGTPQMVARDFPAVHLIASTVNLGFPAANNLAMQRLGLVEGDAESPPLAPEPDYLMLLNPDAELTPGALETLTAFMENHPDVAIAGPTLHYGDGSFQHGAFAFPGILQVGLDLFPIDALPGAHRLYAGSANGRYPQALWQGDAPFPVDFVLGAAMFVRAEAVRAVGGMDEGYFMYCEEMDWAMRTQQRGWQVYAVPGALVIHHEAQSSKQIRWLSWQRMWQSRLRFYALQGDAFAPWTELVVRGLVRTAMWRGIRTARRRFARGVITGTQAGEEIAARTQILARASAT